MYYILLFLIGLCVGSFINVIVFRTYYSRPFVIGRSKCMACNCLIAWYDNIPLISFGLLKGMCRNCKNQISFYYPCVELATSILFLITGIVAWQSGVNIGEFARNLLFVSVLIVIFVMDLKWYVVLDKIIIPSIGIAFLLNWLYNIYSLKSLILGALVGGLFFYIQWFISRGLWLGAGDIRMGVLMGVMLGYPNIIGALFISYIIGGIFSCFVLGLKLKQLSSKLPMATFLSLGTFIYLVFEEQAIFLLCRQLQLFFLC